MQNESCLLVQWYRLKKYFVANTVAKKYQSVPFLLLVMLSTLPKLLPLRHFLEIQSKTEGQKTNIILPEHTTSPTADIDTVTASRTVCLLLLQKC